MRVMVTGGAGYVGSHAVQEMARQGHEVVILDNLSTGHRELCAGFPLIVAGIEDRQTVRAALEDVDAVVHFAGSACVGESVSNPQKYFHNNVRATLALLDCVLESRVRRFVFSSTCAVYGAPERMPVSEKSPTMPLSPYGETKLFVERALAAYEQSHGLRSMVLRYFNAAGAALDGSIGEWHSPETRLLPLALKAALGTAPPLQIFGQHLPTPDGTSIRDYVHVCDLARAHSLAIEALEKGSPSRTLNLGTGHGCSIRCLLETVRVVTGRSVPYLFASARPADPPMLYADASLAREALGWTAVHGLEAMIATAWDWERYGLPRMAAGRNGDAVSATSDSVAGNSPAGDDSATLQLSHTRLR